MKTSKTKTNSLWLQAGPENDAPLMNHRVKFVAFSSHQDICPQDRYASDLPLILG